MQAGRLIFRMWVYLNQQGYGFQPINLAAISSFLDQQRLLPPDWLPSLKVLYPQIVQIFQRDAVLPQEFIPVWGFRTGRVKKGFPESATTYRLPVEQVRR